MNAAWLTVLQQGFLQSRFILYLSAIWLVGATAMTAALWPECPYPYESMAGMGWRLPAVFFVMMGLLVWAGLRQGLDAQLSPAAVQLVPGLRRTAVIVTIVSWLVMAAALGLETCVYGVPFPWIFAALLVCTALTVSRRPSARKYALIALPLLWAPIYGYRFPLPGGPEAAPWVAWLVVLLAMVMGGTFIVRELGKSAEAHASSHRLVRTAPRDARKAPVRGGWDSILKRPKAFQWLFDRTLRSRSPEVRVLHGLGPAFHWSHAAVGGIWQSLPVCLFMYAFSRLFFERDDVSRRSGLDPVLTVAAISAFLFAVGLADFRMRELYARRKEQALLLLLPGAPTGRNVNSWLMQTLVLQHAIAVVSALWFVVAVAFALQQPLESTLKVMAPPLAASLLATCVLVRDYARMRRPRPLKYVLLAIVSIIPLYWAGIFRLSNPVIVMVVAALTSGTIAAWRYACLADAPTAFPVGRLAP